MSEKASVLALDFLFSHPKVHLLWSRSAYAVYTCCIHCGYLYAPFLIFPSACLLSWHHLCFSKSLETFLCV